MRDPRAGMAIAVRFTPWFTHMLPWRAFTSVLDLAQGREGEGGGDEGEGVGVGVGEGESEGEGEGVGEGEGEGEGATLTSTCHNGTRP